MKIPVVARLAVGACWASFLVAQPVQAQCKPGDILIGEDAEYWYCSAPERTERVEYHLNRVRDQLLGEQWRFRKAVIDAAGALARQGIQYQYGGKLRITSGGGVTHICVAEECARHPDVGVDCSGLAEYAAQYSACFVSGFYRAAGVALRGLVNNATGQATHFRKHAAFMPRSGAPSPGDFIFFENTARDTKGITHVGIYLGTTRDGDMLIIHASSRARRVIFSRLSPADDLANKVAGYGDTSLLYTRTR